MGKLIFQTIPLCLILILPLLSDGPAALFTQSSPRVQAREVTAFVYADGGFVQQLTPGSATYTSNFDANGFGSFGWKFTNPTGAPLQNLRFVVFLDADIDRDINTFFNEYGSLVGLALPPGAPSGAIAASSWEIDEPGFLFGNIAQHLLTGNLDNSNGVPSAAPDDVSLALGFQFGTLAPGASLTGNFLIGQTAIGGLKQTDPDSGADLYFNGYLKFASTPPTIAASTIARQQGSPTTAAIIATVSDDLTPTANLAVVPLSVPQGLSIEIGRAHV